ncbi:MAG TPA: hypothetical protein DHT39_07505 [Pantoea sp.]|nr:hypothetical protein D7S44_06590 [Pantoea piersonii]HCW98621.1 hypothetical protein [Pantoea sp.]
MRRSPPTRQPDGQHHESLSCSCSTEEKKASRQEVNPALFCQAQLTSSVNHVTLMKTVTYNYVTFVMNIII